MRNERIDILRFIGLAMIILAHADPNQKIFQLRNFDVPMMVLISGMSFGLSYKGEQYGQYVWKRFKRLVLPVWIFITLYFSFQFQFDRPALPESETIVESYTLMAGFFWIIRVFLLVALTAPFIYKLNARVTSNKQYYLILLSVFLFYEILRWISLTFLGYDKNSYFEQSIAYVIAYGVIFGFGLRVPSLSEKSILTIAFIALAMFTLLSSELWFLNNRFVPTQEYKYPPSGYYFSYALFASLIIWLLSEKLFKLIEAVKLKHITMFIAQNSIWIYLWHTPFVPLIHNAWYIKYPIIFTLAVAITFMQVHIIKRYILPKVSNINTRKNISMILTG